MCAVADVAARKSGRRTKSRLTYPRALAQSQIHRDAPTPERLNPSRTREFIHIIYSAFIIIPKTNSVVFAVRSLLCGAVLLQRHYTLIEHFNIGIRVLFNNIVGSRVCSLLFEDR